MVSVLIPSNSNDYEAQLRRLTTCDPLPPFDPISIDFIDAVSKTVLRDPAMRSMPEMMATAHWMRKAHLLELRDQFELQRGDRIWMARGVALHFAPSNVDSIFVYSWFISLLLGNGNIVRLSQRRGPQVDVLLATLNTLLNEARFQPILQRSLIVSYEHEEELSAKLSAVCHVRVLWGGDESVRRLRAIPLNPVATEVAFANRFSLAVLNAEAINQSDSATLAGVAGKFFNDAYWFDQLACSSPRLLAWAGTAEACKAAQNRFWPALELELRKRGTEYPDMVGMNKLVSAYVSAASGIADQISPGVTGAVTRVHLKNSEVPFRSLECGGGFFFETEISDLHELRHALSERDQTLSYFGFERDELKKFALTLPPRTIDRIVPLGTALDFSVVWDGNNLFRLFSREIDLI